VASARNEWGEGAEVTRPTPSPSTGHLHVGHPRAFVYEEVLPGGASMGSKPWDWGDGVVPFGFLDVPIGPSQPPLLLPAWD
jgi:hypothetical protein